MKKHKVKYTNEPIGTVRITDDFLPKPKDLILKKEPEKIQDFLTTKSSPKSQL